MISRRHQHFLIALLLPLMVLRAMLPAGYMPIAEDGALRIVMCSDGLYPAAAKHAGDHEAEQSGHQTPSDSGQCAFANAALNAPPPATSPFVARMDIAAGAVITTAVPLRAASIVRAQSARGPPAISL